MSEDMSPAFLVTLNQYNRSSGDGGATKNKTSPMKAKKLLLLSALLAPLFTLTAHADDPVEVDGIMYNLVPKGKIATVTQNTNNGYSGPINIPGSITYGGTTYSVVGIEDNAFSSSYVTSVVIPNTVTTIGQYAFYRCGSLTSVTIPESVTKIGELAFYNCSSLTSVIIPESVTIIPYHCFQNCISLTSVTIPNSVTSIGSWAFYDCSNLTSVTIPASVTDIDWGAFSGCSSLTSVTIPASVTSIPNSCFYHCSSLTSVTIPESVTSIGNSAFAGCSSLTSVTIPASVTSIGNSAFVDCSNLTSVTIPASVTSIGESAFYDCSNLTSVTIPESVTTIGDYAFSGCSSLAAVTIPVSVTSIGEGAFYYCSSLTSVTIPESVTSIPDLCFYYCSSLTSVTIPESVTSIGNGCFSGCISLTSVTIPASVTSIGQNTFSGCSSLTSVTIPESITNIASWAFYGCSSLTSVTIPESVTYIGVEAFRNCGNLISVLSLVKNPFSFDENAFSDISDKCVLTVPVGKVETYIANGWTTDVFEGGVVEASFVVVSIGEQGAATFCSSVALDFSGTEDVKAYIVSAYNPSTGTVTLTRITDVPAGTGIVVLGEAGTYAIPLGTGETVVSNLLVGTTEAKTLNKTEDANSNFILSDGENGVGFYAVTDGSTLDAGKAYLSLPTSALPTNARSIGLRFGDGTTNVRSMENGAWTMDNEADAWFGIDGRRLDAQPTTRGLYIVNGKKVIVK